MQPAHAQVVVPELELEVSTGTLGGLVTTVEGLVRAVETALKNTQVRCDPSLCTRCKRRLRACCPAASALGAAGEGCDGGGCMGDFCVRMPASFVQVARGCCAMAGRDSVLLSHAWISESSRPMRMQC